jgi:hypothetical protein
MLVSGPIVKMFYLAPGTDIMRQFLAPETDIMGQFLGQKISSDSGPNRTLAKRKSKNN